jgi:F-type H+-transporting ATPase subunit a
MILTGIDINRIIGFGFKYLPGEAISFYCVCLICIILALIVGALARNYNSEKKLLKFEKRVVKLNEKIIVCASYYDKKIKEINNEISLSNNSKKTKKLQEKLTKLSQKEKLVKLSYELEEVSYDVDNFPYVKPRGLYNFFEMYVEFIERNVLDIMDYRFENFTGYILGLSMFMLISFIFGLTGFPNPFSYLGSTLSIALVTFLMIHITSIHYTHWKYFKRYIEPVPFFLPINLLSMWSPLISLSLRLFGNALAGWCFMTLVYYALTIMVGNFPILLAPLVTPILHAYFDIFSGTIQTLVFCLLSMIFISQEAPELEETKLTMGSSYRE